MRRLILLFLPGALLNLTSLSAQNTEIRYLSGTGNDATVPWEFRIDRGRNSGQWTTIPVPSNWELQGFGVYNYGRGENEPSDETGEYRHRFRVPAGWRGKRVNIVFDGVMTDAHVKVNGREAGPVHRGGFYRFAYDVSDKLNYDGENLLEVTVKNRSDNASVNAAEREADYWIFGGIFRPVFLEAKPQQHIERVAVDARADGALAVHVYLNGLAAAGTVEAQVLTLDGQAVGAPFSSPATAGSDSVVLRSRIDGVRTWTPEFPNRYRLEVRLRQDDQTRHRLAETIGFRTVELRPGDGIYVNGAKIMFKGVNRHSFWPESGRTTSYELSVRDVELMKDMNMNAVRMSHYPPDVHFLDVCDSLGLFVLDELAGWQAAYDTDVGEKLVRELVTRDVSHPSVIVWDNGNEGGSNFGVDDEFHRYDPQRRPLIHPWAKFRGTDTQHYINYDCCAGAAFHGSEVFFPTELLHGLYDGGHGAGLQDFWNAMRNHPLSAGAFLWVFSDEGVVRSDQDGLIDTWTNNAPDGILGPYREKEGSFYTIKELWNPVHIQAPANMASFGGRLRVENRYHYTSLDRCRFDWQLLRFPGPEAGGTEPDILHAGAAAAPAVAPGEAGWLSVDLPGEWRQTDALSLTVTDPHGRELFTYVFPITRPADVARRILPDTPAQAGLGQDDETLTLSANGTTVQIDKRSGLIRSIRNAGGPLSFNGGPAPTDSMLASLPLQKMEVLPGENAVAFRFSADVTDRPNRPHWSVRYTLLPSGWLQMDYEFLPRQGNFDYLGVNFNYPEEKVNGVKWLGRGPYRVWKNRLAGPQLGLWEKAYNNTVTGESGWEYPEFKGYHADLYWARFDTDEGPFVLATATPGLFLRLFTPAPPEGAYNDHTDGAFPGGDISLMHAISPIGTKFKPAEDLGPQSRPNQVHYNPNVVPFRATVFLGNGKTEKQKNRKTD